jgi:hypothetical protein
VNILDVLASGPTAFRGKGVNHENESFIGMLRVQSLEGGRAVMLSYSATLETGTVAHSESTLLGTGPDGRLCLWPVMSELPVVLPHKQVMTRAESGKYTLAVFGSGSREDSTRFREEISIRVNSDGSLVYGHAWGLPSGNFDDRSSCSMVPSGA